MSKATKLCPANLQHWAGVERGSLRLGHARLGDEAPVSEKAASATVAKRRQAIHFGRVWLKVAQLPCLSAIRAQAHLRCALHRKHDVCWVYSPQEQLTAHFIAPRLAAAWARFRFRFIVEHSHSSEAHWRFVRCCTAGATPAPCCTEVTRTTERSCARQQL